MTQIKENYSLKGMFRFGVFAAFALCLFFSVFYWFMNKLEQKIVFDAVSFNKNWSVLIDDRKYINIDLTDFSFPVVSTGTTIELENVLPQFNVPNPVLRIYTLYCTVELYLNDELVYTYGQELLKKSKNVGCGAHVTSLENYKQGDRVKIILNVTEKRSFTSFQPAWIESAEKTFGNMLSGRLFLIFIAVFLVVLGLVSSFVILFFVFFNKPIAKILALSQSLLWLGIFELYTNRCMVIFFSNYSLNSWMEHVSLYCTNFAVLALFYTVITRRKIEKQIVLCLIYIFAVYCALILLLDYSGVMHLPATRNVQFVLLGIEIIFALYISIRNIRLQFWQERLPSIGFLLMLFFFIVDIVRYPVQKYLMLNLAVMQGSPVSFGLLIFLTVMVSSYLLNIRPESGKKAMQALNEKHLRLDYQTGFLNSFAINEYLKSLDENERGEFSILMLQLVPAGRETPDLLSLDVSDILVAFSNHIKENLNGRAEIGYFGNAEFCAISQDLRKEDIHRLLITLDEQLFTEIQKHPRFQYTLAHGLVFRSEVEHLTYLLPLAKERLRSHKDSLHG